MNNDINKLADNIIDELGESIMNEICANFGNSLDWETSEEMSNLIWERIKARM